MYIFLKVNICYKKIKKVFNIDEYNDSIYVKEGLKKGEKERNWDARKSAAVMSDGLHKYYLPLSDTPDTRTYTSGTLTAYNPRFMKHVLGFLGEKNRNKNEVLKLIGSGGKTKRKKSWLQKTLRQ